MCILLSSAAGVNPRTYLHVLGGSFYVLVKESDTSSLYKNYLISCKSYYVEFNNEMSRIS